MSIKPECILITGASSGIGAALALEFANAGVTLALTGRDAARLESVRAACEQRGAEVLAETHDVTDVAAMADWIGRVDILRPLDLVIAGAGVVAGVGFGRPRELHTDAVRVMTTNVIGVINTIDPPIVRMTPRGAGHIAIIGSLASHRGLPYSSAYCASKAALRVYAQALRANLSRTGVGVSLIEPGFVITPMVNDTSSPMPLAMSAERAARIIRKGLLKRKKTIVFPQLLYAAMLLLAVLPSALVDSVMERIAVDIPE